MVVNVHNLVISFVVNFVSYRLFQQFALHFLDSDISTQVKGFVLQVAHMTGETSQSGGFTHAALDFPHGLLLLPYF